jgi:hypothetical protein
VSESDGRFYPLREVLALVTGAVVLALSNSPEIHLEQETTYTDIVTGCSGI